MPNHARAPLLPPTLLRRLLLCLLAISCFSAAGAPAAPGAGDMAPDDLGLTVKGDAVKVSDYAGKVVVVSFWASWCAYCLKELPVLEDIQNSSAKDHIQVIAVNTEERAVFKKLERAFRGASLKLTYDPVKASAAAYGVNGLPHLLIIGRSGRILKVYRGYSESSLDGIIADLNLALAEQAGK